jgi:MerR family transcriptional regulator, thiopeptide resistance regulator
MHLQSSHEAALMGETSRTPQGQETSLPGRDAAGTAGSTIPRFYMSGDLRAATGLSRTQLDYYLREGLVLPTARTESGYLLFDEQEREVVERIIAWREEGIGLKDIRQRLGREEIR